MSVGDETKEPQLQPDALFRRCTQLESKFSAALEQSRGQIEVYAEVLGSEAFVYLGGRASEVIERNMGRKHRVVKLCALSDDMFIWVGFRERWAQTQKGKKLSFIEAGVTFHAGRQGELMKPQLMRSEWVGRRGSGRQGNAGHPHWQIDLLETIRNQVEEDFIQRENRFDATYSEESQPNVMAVQSSRDLLDIPFERLHLASAAAWWRGPSVTISHAPATMQELDHWIVGSVSYTRREFLRCKLTDF